VGIGSSRPEKWRVNHGSVFAEGVTLYVYAERGYLPNKFSLVPRLMAICSNSVHGLSSTLREDKGGSVTGSGGRIRPEAITEFYPEHVAIPEIVTVPNVESALSRRVFVVHGARRHFVLNQHSDARRNGSGNGVNRRRKKAARRGGGEVASLEAFDKRGNLSSA